MRTERGRLLAEAAKATEGPRGRDYGTPAVNLGERTADLWDAYLRHRDSEVDGRGRVHHADSGEGGTADRVACT
jgi:hypothetical protein